MSEATIRTVESYVHAVRISINHAATPPARVKTFVCIVCGSTKRIPGPGKWKYCTDCKKYGVSRSDGQGDSGTYWYASGLGAEIDGSDAENEWQLP